MTAEELNNSSPDTYTKSSPSRSKKKITATSSPYRVKNLLDKDQLLLNVKQCSQTKELLIPPIITNEGKIG
jgi:hypothetical protein